MEESSSRELYRQEAPTRGADKWRDLSLNLAKDTFRWLKLWSLKYGPRVDFSLIIRERERERERGREGEIKGEREGDISEGERMG